MAPSDGTQEERIEHNSDALTKTIQLTEGISEQQTFATTVTSATTTLMGNTRHLRESVIARRATHNGMFAVIFKTKDYYGIMADECRLTIVGRFLKPKPQIERIRATFREKFLVILWKLESTTIIIFF